MRRGGPTLRVYLAGPVRTPHDWRQEFADALRCDPALVTLIRPGGQMPYGEDADPELRSELYVPADLVAIATAHVVVACISHEHSGRGTAVEVGYALANRKPVLPLIRWPQDVTATRYAWRFLLGAVPHVYDLATAAATVGYMARQASGETLTEGSWKP